MTDTEKIDELIRKVDGLSFQMGRFASDIESEKDTRKRRNDQVDTVLYGTGDRPGLLVRVDRLETFQSDQKSDKKQMAAIWIAIILMFVERVFNIVLTNGH